MFVPMRGLGAACSALSMDQIYQVARNAGFPPDVATQMTAIAMRESSGCPTAYNGGNPPGKESSYGLWQINVKGNPSLIASMGIQPSDLFNPDVNASAAFRLWNGRASNLNTAWYIDRSGPPLYYKENYEKYLPGAQLAASRVNGQGIPSLPGLQAPDAQPIIAAGGLDGSVNIGGVNVPIAGLFFGGMLLFGLVYSLRR